MKTFILSVLCFLFVLQDQKVECVESDEALTCRNKECVLFSSIMDSLLSSAKNPCKNFFDFACGKFVKSTVIHDRYGEQGFSTALTDKAEEKIRKLLAARETDNELRAFKLAKKTYQMCINHDQLDKDGAKPLFELFESLGGWNLLDRNANKIHSSWQRIYENVLENGFISDYLMSIYLATNPKDTTRYTIKINPPSREDFNRGYYDLLPQGLNNSLVTAYYKYMKDFSVLLGANEDDAAREMLEVLEFEQKLFKAVKEKDPEGKPASVVTTLDELQAKFSFIEWKRFIEIYLGNGFKLSGSDVILVNNEFYFKNLADLMKETPARIIENYFMWRVADYSKFYMSVEYKQPALKLQETLYGRQTAEQQWKRCVSQLKKLLAIATTSMVARSENAQGRGEVNEIIEAVKVQVKNALQKIPMDTTEKETLIEKVLSVSIFAGYPDELYDDAAVEKYYSALEIADGEFFKSVFKLEAFLAKSYGERILNPIAETRWQTGNSFSKSFYSSGKKTIYIHSNDLKSPIFNADLPSYVNYARFGWQVASLYGIAISFELDKMNSSWYENVSQHIQKQYYEFVIDNFNISVDPTKASRINFADFLSFELSYKAMKFEMDNLTKAPLRLPGLDFTLDQFFWISAIQRYCHVNKDQETIQKIVLSNFPIESFRANNPRLNNADFASDFQCLSEEHQIKDSLYPKSFAQTNTGKMITNNLAFVLFTIFLILF